MRPKITQKIPSSETKWRTNGPPAGASGGAFGGAPHQPGERGGLASLADITSKRFISFNV